MFSTFSNISHVTSFSAICFAIIGGGCFNSFANEKHGKARSHGILSGGVCMSSIICSTLKGICCFSFVANCFFISSVMVLINYAKSFLILLFVVA